MSLGQRSIGVLGDALVELVVLLRSDFAWLASPDGLSLVDQLPVPSGLLNLVKNKIRSKFNGANKLIHE